MFNFDESFDFVHYSFKYTNSNNNPYGRYGSPYSSDSVNNPYSSGGPVIKGR